MNTNLIGTITELRVQTYFLEHECMVSVPQSPCRYDFILDYNYKMYKIQVKTSSTIEDGAILRFSTSSSRPTGKHVSYKDDHIDFFCTIHNNECYLIPVEECGKDECRLRLKPTKNGQTKNIRFAKDYIAMDILNK